MFGFEKKIFCQFTIKALGDIPGVELVYET
jgi:hypothetical protein